MYRLISLSSGLGASRPVCLSVGKKMSKILKTIKKKISNCQNGFGAEQCLGVSGEVGRGRIKGDTRRKRNKWRKRRRKRRMRRRKMRMRDRYIAKIRFTHCKPLHYELFLLIFVLFIPMY